MKTSKKQLGTLAILFLLFAASSCSNKGGNGAAGVKEYQVIEVRNGSVTLVKEYPATLEGQQTVEIRPRITGYIEEILVDEGDFVRKGQVLFRLNAEDIQANVRSAEAQVKVAEAQVETSRLNLEKTKPLVEKQIVSSFNLKEAEVALLSSESQLTQAKASLANARANLGYAVITSPTDGIIGTFPYRVGSLVSSSSTSPLTSISNTTNIYAYFSMNEKEFLDLTRNLPGKTRHEQIANLPEVTLTLADKTGYDQPGKIEAASGLVDTQTGSVNLRATFSNPNRLLSSGSSGRIQFPQHIEKVILIPQKASFELQGKHFVYLVGPENKLVATEVGIVTGNMKDTYAVTTGLNPGDRIVIEGITSLRNDLQIQPALTEWSSTETASN